jgi:hypothetical protein
MMSVVLCVLAYATADIAMVNRNIIKAVAFAFIFLNMVKPPNFLFFMQSTADVSQCLLLWLYDFHYSQNGSYSPVRQKYHCSGEQSRAQSDEYYLQICFHYFRPHISAIIIDINNPICIADNASDQ